MTKFQHLIEAREKLSPNNLEAGLPGREMHHEEIYKFLLERLKIRYTTQAKRAKVSAGQVADIKSKHMNKIMFLSGVPGTGKTATAFSVIEKLERVLKETKPCPIHPFDVAYVNGEHLSKPERVYSEILYQLTKKNFPPEKAEETLDKMFIGENDEDLEDRPSKRSRASSNYFKIVIIDELDLLYSDKRQSVFYSLFDWPTTSNSRLILLTIANAMDLPDRFMRGKISSRFGCNRLVFESYTSDCLVSILRARLGKNLDRCFDKKAVDLATKRIGRTTGDARRILDTCRLAIDKAIEDKSTIVTVAIISQIGYQNLDAQVSNYVKSCPPLELFTLKCILIEAARIGEDNVQARGVYLQLIGLISKDSFFKNYFVSSSQFNVILVNLAAIGMIYLENDKPLMKKRLFIRHSSEPLTDLITNEKIKIT